MYAVLIDRNKQYKVKIGNIIKIEKINMKIGEKIIFEKIILLSKKDRIYIGNPILKNFYIEGCIYAQKKSKKIKIIKFNRRKHYKKKQGHRQLYTEILINKIINNTTQEIEKNGS